MFFVPFVFMDRLRKKVTEIQKYKSNIVSSLGRKIFQCLTGAFSQSFQEHYA